MTTLYKHSYSQRNRGFPHAYFSLSVFTNTGTFTCDWPFETYEPALSNAGFRRLTHTSFLIGNQDTVIFKSLARVITPHDNVLKTANLNREKRICQGPSDAQSDWKAQLFITRVAQRFSVFILCVTPQERQESLLAKAENARSSSTPAPKGVRRGEDSSPSFMFMSHNHARWKEVSRRKTVPWHFLRPG